MLNTSDALRTTRTEDGRICLDVRHGRMFSINVVGSQILELIEQGWDETRIAGEISRLYTTSIDAVSADVHSFIEALRKNNILQG
jgi:hypothetical protein